MKKEEPLLFFFMKKLNSKHDFFFSSFKTRLLDIRFFVCITLATPSAGRSVQLAFQRYCQLHFATGKTKTPLLMSFGKFGILNMITYDILLL